MLSAGIIIPGEKEGSLFDSLQNLEGVEWCGLYSRKVRIYEHWDNVMIFPSPDILPMLCDLIIVLDPYYCNFDYLSTAIRNGCHLFLAEKLNLSLEERKALIHLAKEGQTIIQVRNDLLFQPFHRQIIQRNNGNCFIEARQSTPWETGVLHENLSDNLLLILKAVGASPHRVNVYCGCTSLKHPDVLNIHINFTNGSAASLMMTFISYKTHFFSIYDDKGLRTFDFKQLSLNRMIEYQNPFSIKNQIKAFVKNVEEKTNPVFSITDELELFLLMEKIREKFELHSVIL